MAEEGVLRVRDVMGGGVGGLAGKIERWVRGAVDGSVFADRRTRLHKRFAPLHRLV